MLADIAWRGDAPYERATREVRRLEMASTSKPDLCIDGKS
jgi:hypothetical protein